MLKTYPFKTHCKGDSHSSKTANIILPGLIIKQESVRPRWPYDMRPSVRAEKYIRDSSGAEKTDNGTDGQTDRQSATQDAAPS